MKLVIRLILAVGLAGMLAAQIMAATPTTADKAFGAAKQFYNLHLDTQAIDELQSFITTYPADLRCNEAGYMLGRVYQRKLEYNKALAAYQPVVLKALGLEFAHLRGETHFQMAECYFQLQRYDKAVVAYDNCVKIAADYDPDLTARARYWKAESLYQLKRTGEAETEYQKVATSAPKHAMASWALYSVGMIELRQEHFADAISPLERVTTDYKDSEVLGEATLALGFAYAGRARTNDPNKSVDIQADYQKAITLFTTVIDSERSTPTARNQATLAQAEAYFGLKDYAHAEAAYAKALQTMRNGSQQALETRMWRAHALYNSERFADAAAEYGKVADEAISEDGKIKFAELANQSLYWLGNSWHQLAAKTKDNKVRRMAIAAFRRFLTVAGDDHPQAPRASLLIAFSLEDMADTSDAARNEAVTAFKTVLDKWRTAREAKEAENGIARLTLTMKTEDLAKYIGMLPPGAAAWNANLRLAREDFINNRYEKTIAGVKQIIDSKPDGDARAQAYYLLGASHQKLASDDAATAQQKLAHDDEAIAAYKQVLGVQSTGELVQFAQRGLVQAYLDRHAYVDALQAAQALLKLNLSADDAVEARMYLAEAYLDNQQHDAAIAAYQQVVKDAPTSALAPSALMGLAWVAEKKKDLPLAISSYRTLLENFPTHKLAPDASFRLGADLATQKDYAAAVAAFINVPVDHKLADQAAYAMAWAYRDQGKEEEANTQFAVVADKFPKSTLAIDSLYRIGEYWLQQKDYGKALPAFTRAQEKIGQGEQAPLVAQLAPLIAYKRGVSAYFSEQYAEAATAFGKVAANYPTSEYMAESLFWRGQALEKQGTAQAVFARDAYTQYLTKFPTQALLLDASVGAGRCALAAKQYDTARDDLHKTVDLCEKYAQGSNPALTDRAKNVAPEAQFYLGQSYLEEKKYGDALKEFARVSAYQYEPWYSRSLLQMARCSALQNDKDAATRTLQILIRTFPKSDAAQDALKAAKEFNITLQPE